MQKKTFELLRSDKSLVANGLYGGCTVCGMPLTPPPRSCV